MSVTTGFGIAAFYPQPIMPTYPPTTYDDVVPYSCNSSPLMQSSAECQAALAKERKSKAENEVKREKYEVELKSYVNKSAGYNRTSIFLGIVIGAIFAIVGIGLIKVSKLVANGLLLAGILTAILTRLLINLASLGSSTTGTAGPDTFSYIEFAVLFLLSIVVIVVGLVSLKEHPVSSAALVQSPAPQAIK